MPAKIVRCRSERQRWQQPAAPSARLARARGKCQKFTRNRESSGIPVTRSRPLPVHRPARQGGYQLDPRPGEIGTSTRRARQLQPTCQLKACEVEMEQRALTRMRLTIVLLMFTLGSVAAASAQTVGYSEAIGQFAVACGKDIDKFCKTTNLGGGRTQQCLDQNEAGVSASCKTTISALRANLQARAAARAAVFRVCDVDVRKFCAGIQQGDGNLMECFYKARRNMSAQCQQTVVDAGYDVSIGAAPPPGQIKLDAAAMVGALQGVDEAATSGLSAASLRQLAAQGIRDPSRANRMNREPLSKQLGSLAQFTIAIQFDLGSARIRPDSFKAVGLLGGFFVSSVPAGIPGIDRGARGCEGKSRRQSQTEPTARRRGP